MRRIEIAITKNFDRKAMDYCTMEYIVGTLKTITGLTRDFYQFGLDISSLYLLQILELS
jgi:hypothetical protein